MRGVGFGKSDKYEFRGKDISGLTLNAYLVHTTANTAFTGQPILWDQVNVSMVLKRNGQSFVIFDDAVLPLAADSNFTSGSFEQVMAIGTVALPKLVAAASGVKEILLMTAKIKLHDVINLRGDDEIVVEVTPASSGAGTGVDTTVSEIQWDIEEGIGNGISIPCIKAETLKQNESNTPITLGDNIVQCTFINNDKSGITSANQVLSSAIFSSDKLNRTDKYEELIAKRDALFVSQAESAKRHQCFLIVSVPIEKYTGADVRLNRANLRLQLISTNVNAGKNWIVKRSFWNDTYTAQAAVQRDQKHAKENANQYV
jgi:hypothetical protein